jgi:nucleoid-associated protein YgaU
MKGKPLQGKFLGILFGALLFVLLFTVYWLASTEASISGSLGAACTSTGPAETTTGPAQTTTGSSQCVEEEEAKAKAAEAAALAEAATARAAAARGEAEARAKIAAEAEASAKAKAEAEAKAKAEAQAEAAARIRPGRVKVTRGGLLVSFTNTYAGTITFTGSGLVEVSHVFPAGSHTVKLTFTAKGRAARRARSTMKLVIRQKVGTRAIVRTLRVRL